MMDEQRLQRDMLQAHEQNDLAALPPLYLAAARSCAKTRAILMRRVFSIPTLTSMGLIAATGRLPTRRADRLRSHGRDR